MKFSKNFLNKLLNSAINFHNNKQEVNELPLKFNNIDTTIENLKNVIKFEANKSLQKEIISDSPLLHAVNLKTKNPGIISDKNEQKLTIHRQKVQKKEKTPEQIANELEKKMIRDEKKNKINEEKEQYKNENKEIKQIEKKIKNNNKEIDKKKDKKMKKENKKKKNKKDYEMIDQLDNEINDLENNTNKIAQEYENKKGSFNEKKNKYEKIKQEKKEDLEKKKIDREGKRKEKQEKKEQKIAQEERIYMEELYNIINEQCNDQTENDLLNEMNENSVKIYESPLPYQRHIDSLDYTDPHESLINTLLTGKKPQNDSSLTLYHGPPGTGKTYKLIQTLKNLQNKHGRILVCAASNIGTLNLYNRAKSFKIKGSLVLANYYIGNFSDEERDNWKPTTDKIVFSTISMRYGSILRGSKFKTILIDEAAQCQESWTWGLFRNEVRHIYLAGDPHQLPAVVSQEGIILKHDRSLMSRLIELKYPTVFLDVQRRMHPDIVKFPNENFYNNKIKTDYKNKYKIKPFKIIDVKGKEKRIGTSYQNKIEAEYIIKLVKKINIKDTIVICPYKAQCKLLKGSKLNVFTIDSFQGREAECVIISTVRSENKIGFWKDYRRLNVALTRAKHVLRIVGNTDTWKSEDSYLNKLNI